jgi:hypothetical protein
MDIEELLLELSIGMKRTKAVEAHISKRMKTKRCLVHECPRSCREPGSCLGRCSKHAAALRRELMNLSFSAKNAIRIKYIRSGTLLENHEIRRYLEKEAC